MGTPPLVSPLVLVLLMYFVNCVQAGFFIPQADKALSTEKINNNTEIISNVHSQTECILICERLAKSESFLANDGKCFCSDEFKMVTKPKKNDDGGNNGDNVTNVNGQIFKKVIES